MTNKQAYAGLRERLLHMVNTHHAIKDCAAMQEAAEAISSLLKLLGEARACLVGERDTDELHRETIARIDAALPGEKL